MFFIVQIESLGAYEIIVSHTGANDLVVEGWENRIQTNTTFGPVFDDQGFDAWFVDDMGSGIGDGGGYWFDVSDAQIQNAHSNGWKISANIRNVSYTPYDGRPNQAGVTVNFDDGTSNFVLSFQGSEGDPFVRVLLINGPEFVVAGDGYHLYEFVYDPVTASADVLVDGVLRVANYAGVPHTGVQRILWGSGDSRGQGRGHYNLV